MKKTNKLTTALLLAAVASFTTSANAFVDPEDWKMDKWGGWDKWDGPPEAREWKKEYWGQDMKQWGPSGWQTPWGSQPGWGGGSPWGGRGGGMPWGGGDRGGWGGMPWGGGNNGGWGGMPWGGNRGWGQQQPYGYGPQQGWSAPQQPPAADLTDRYPRRPKGEEAETATTGDATTE